MRLIESKEDYERTMDVLTRCFVDTPGMTWMFADNIDRKKGIFELSKYMLDESRLYDGAFISNDGAAIVFMFKMSDEKFSFRKLKYQLRFLIRVTGIKNAIRAAKLKKMTEEIRPREGYVAWLLASDPEVKNTEGPWDIKNSVHNMSVESGLPIFAETTNPRVRLLYRSIGFREYHSMDHPFIEGGKVYFVRRDPGSDREKGNHKDENKKDQSKKETTSEEVK